MNHTFLSAAALLKIEVKTFCALFFKECYPICLKGCGLRGEESRSSGLLKLNLAWYGNYVCVWERRGRFDPLFSFRKKGVDGCKLGGFRQIFFFLIIFCGMKKRLKKKKKINQRGCLAQVIVIAHTIWRDWLEMGRHPNKSWGMPERKLETNETSYTGGLWFVSSLSLVAPLLVCLRWL